MCVCVFSTPPVFFRPYARPSVTGRRSASPTTTQLSVGRRTPRGALTSRFPAVPLGPPAPRYQDSLFLPVSQYLVSAYKSLPSVDGSLEHQASFLSPTLPPPHPPSYWIDYSLWKWLGWFWILIMEVVGLSVFTVNDLTFRYCWAVTIHIVLQKCISTERMCSDSTLFVFLSSLNSSISASSFIIIFTRIFAPIRFEKSFWCGL